jgi:hypothetical protein
MFVYLVVVMVIMYVYVWMNVLIPMEEATESKDNINRSHYCLFWVSVSSFRFRTASVISSCRLVVVAKYLVVVMVRLLLEADTAYDCNS